MGGKVASGGNIWTPSKSDYLTRIRGYIILGSVCFWVGGVTTAILSALSLFPTLIDNSIHVGEYSFFPIPLGMFFGGFFMIVLNTSIHKKNIMIVVAFYTLSVIIFSLGLFSATHNSPEKHDSKDNYYVGQLK